MKMIQISLILAICCVAQSSVADVSMWYHSKVTKVVDGDTLIVSNKVQGSVTMLGEATVILDSVNAPELEQPGGPEAKQFLEGLVKGKDIFVVERTDMGTSRGAWVFVGEEKKSVNVLLIEEGKAWAVEPRVISDFKAKREHMKMKDALKKAKEQKKGLWATENPIPPWEWIKSHPKKEEAQPEE